MALVVTASGGLSLIAGMLLLGSIAGSYDLSVILQRGDMVRASPLYLPPAPTVAFIDEERCIGCTKCLPPCPVDAITGARAACTP